MMTPQRQRCRWWLGGVVVLLLWLTSSSSSSSSSSMFVGAQTSPATTTRALFTARVDQANWVREGEVQSPYRSAGEAASKRATPQRNFPELLHVQCPYGECTLRSIVAHQRVVSVNLHSAEHVVSLPYTLRSSTETMSIELRADGCGASTADEAFHVDLLVTRGDASASFTAATDTLTVFGRVHCPPHADTAVPPYVREMLLLDVAGEVMSSTVAEQFRADLALWASVPVERIVIAEQDYHPQRAETQVSLFVFDDARHDDRNTLTRMERAANRGVPGELAGLTQVLHASQVDRRPQGFYAHRLLNITSSTSSADFSADDVRAGIARNVEFHYDNNVVFAAIDQRSDGATLSTYLLNSIQQDDGPAIHLLKHNFERGDPRLRDLGLRACTELWVAPPWGVALHQISLQMGTPFAQYAKRTFVGYVAAALRIDDDKVVVREARPARTDVVDSTFVSFFITDTVPSPYAPAGHVRADDRAASSAFVAMHRNHSDALFPLQIDYLWSDEGPSAEWPSWYREGSDPDRSWKIAGSFLAFSLYAFLIILFIYLGWRKDDNRPIDRPSSAFDYQLAYD